MKTDIFLEGEKRGKRKMRAIGRGKEGGGGGEEEEEEERESKLFLYYRDILQSQGLQLYDLTS